MLISYKQLKEEEKVQKIIQCTAEIIENYWEEHHTS